MVNKHTSGFNWLFPAADYTWTPTAFDGSPENEERPFWLDKPKIIAASFDLFGSYHEGNGVRDLFHALAMLAPRQRFVAPTQSPEAAATYYDDTMTPCRICQRAAEFLRDIGQGGSFADSLERNALLSGLSAIKDNGFLFPNVVGAYYISGRLSPELIADLDRFAMLPFANRAYWFGRGGSLFRFSHRMEGETYKVPQDADICPLTDIIDLEPVKVRRVHWVVCEATDAKRSEVVLSECIESGTPVWFTNPNKSRPQMFPVSWAAEEAAADTDAKSKKLLEYRR